MFEHGKSKIWQEPTVSDAFCSAQGSSLRNPRAPLALVTYESRASMTFQERPGIVLAESKRTTTPLGPMNLALQ